MAVVPFKSVAMVLKVVSKISYNGNGDLTGNATERICFQDLRVSIVYYGRVCHYALYLLVRKNNAMYEFIPEKRYIKKKERITS